MDAKKLFMVQIEPLSSHMFALDKIQLSLLLSISLSWSMFSSKMQCEYIYLLLWKEEQFMGRLEGKYPNILKQA